MTVEARIRVLVVDDDQDVRKTIGYALSGRLDVDLVESGQAALERLRDHVYDVLLADQRMPGMSGVDLCAATVDRHPKLKRVILTAYSDLDACENAINRGRVDCWIRKPFDADKLVDEIVAQATPTSAATRRRVLIVDDEPSVLRVMARMLEADYDVSTADTAADARAAIEAQTLDAAVCDLRLRDGSGIDVCAFADEHNPLIARLIVTGADDVQHPEVIESINRGHIHSWLQKPIGNQELRGAVADAIRHARAGDPAQREAKAEAAFDRVCAKIESQRQSWDPRARQH